MNQLDLFAHRFPEVDIKATAYKDGYLDGFVAPRDAPQPERPPRWTDRRWRHHIAGWLDGRERSKVPDWRL